AGSAESGWMVWTPAPGMSKTMVSTPAWLLASRMAWRSEPGPLSSVLLTWNAFGMILAIWLAAVSVNQMLPSGPAARIGADGVNDVDTGYSVTTPVGVIRPIWFALNSVNHRLPSGPATMS